MKEDKIRKKLQKQEEAQIRKVKKLETQSRLKKSNKRKDKEKKKTEKNRRRGQSLRKHFCMRQKGREPQIRRDPFQLLVTHNQRNAPSVDKLSLLLV